MEHQGQITFQIEQLPMNDLQKVVRDISKPEQILQPRNHIQQVALTDRDGLDMAYKSNNNIAIIGNTLYIARTNKIDWVIGMIIARRFLHYGMSSQ